MVEPGACETGCREQNLELVRAAAYDTVVTIRSSARARADAFLGVAEKLARRQAGGRTSEDEYEALRQEARELLRGHPDPAGADETLNHPTVAAATWWCPECGGIDAPQPCLGICVWRRVEWIKRSLYEQERAAALVERSRERRLRDLLRRLGWVTPHRGQWERSLLVLQAEAQRTLSRIVQAS